MKKQEPTKSHIDEIVQGNRSWIKRKIALMNKKNIKTWQGIFLLAFLTGMVVSITLMVKFNIETVSQAGSNNFSFQQSTSGNANDLSYLDKQLLNAAKEYLNDASVLKDKSKEKVVKSAFQRKEKMLSQMEQDSYVFLLHALPEEIYDKLPKEAQEIVEQNVEVEGILTVTNADDFDNKKSRTEYTLEDKNDKAKKYKLHFAENQPDIYSGSAVKVKGVKLDSNIVLAYTDSGASSGLEILSTSNPLASGEQKTIVIVADYFDAAVSCSVADIRDRVFTDPLNKSIDDFYQEMSFGQLWLAGDVAGPFTINYTTTSTCDISAWSSAAEAAATASGVNLSAYNRKIYVFPKTNPCGYIGCGTVGGNPSRSWIFRCDQSDTYAHEFGHNIGMNHASTPTDEYGDTSDIMGYGSFGLRQINAPHQDQMRWIDSSKFQNITESGVYNISPLELSASQALYPQVLMVPKPDSGETYYFSYRQPIGFDAVLSPTYLKGVNMHRFYTGTAKRTYFLNVLSDGGNFTDLVNGVTITQLSHNSNYVTAQIDLSEPSCVRANPSISVYPISQTGSSGSSLNYAVTVTNNNSPTCLADNYSLNNSSLPYYWTSFFSLPGLYLGSGNSDSSTWTISSNSSASNGTYPVTLTVTDSFNNSYQNSTSASYVVFTPDIAAPTTYIASPLSGATVSGAVSIVVSASDNVGVAKVEIWKDGTLFGTNALSSSLFSWDTTKDSNGSHTLQAKAYDMAGNIGTSVLISVTVNNINSSDTQPPTVSITKPTNGSTIPSKGNLSISASASDNVGIAQIKILFDSAIIKTCSSATICSVSYSTKKIVSGAHIISATAADAAGNTRSAQVSVTKK